MNFAIGDVIGERYEVVRKFSGGMGIVLLCVDDRSGGAPVALKTFKPEFLAFRDTRDRFLRESATWIALGAHPNIVPAHQVERFGDGLQVFLVLKFIPAVEGMPDSSLRSRLKTEGALSLRQGVYFGLQIARGMVHATERIPNLVHRDLKPENLLVGRDGFVRITDFGLAATFPTGMEPGADRFESAGFHPFQTQMTRGAAGTPLYMSPEQWTGGALDPRSDMYAWGCILYEMLSGTLTVSGDDIASLARAHVSGQASRAPLLPTWPTELQTLLRRTLATTTGERPSSWREIEYVLSRVYQGVTGMEAPVPPADLSRVEIMSLGWSHNALGNSYYDLGKFDKAKWYFENALALARRENNPLMEGAALGNLGLCLSSLGQHDHALSCFDQSVGKKRTVGDKRGLGNTLGNMGDLFLKLGDTERAVSFYGQALELKRELGDRRGEASLLNAVGQVNSLVGNHREAVAVHQRALSILKDLGDVRGIAVTLGSLGQNFRRTGDSETALTFSSEALEKFRAVGDRLGEARELSFQGHTFFALRKMYDAVVRWQESLAVAEEIGDKMLIASNKFMLAQMMISSKQLKPALVLAQSAHDLYIELGRPDWARDAEQVMARIVKEMDAKA